MYEIENLRSGQQIGIRHAAFNLRRRYRRKGDAPIATKAESTRLACRCRLAMPNASGLRNAAAPTSTAARPTRLWKAATSCGIAVIWIRLAVTSPITPPMAIAIAISRVEATSWMASVVTTAMAMPIMPSRLPRWLDAGLDRPRSARMKQMPATR